VTEKPRRPLDSANARVRINTGPGAALTHGGKCLTVGGKTYLLARPRVGRAWVALLTADGLRYLVTPWACDCKDWRYRRSRSGGHCKHQRAAFALGLLEDPDEALARSLENEDHDGAQREE
jgi:hypothetical protein